MGRSWPAHSCARHRTGCISVSRLGDNGDNRSGNANGTLVDFKDVIDRGTSNGIANDTPRQQQWQRQH